MPNDEQERVRRVAVIAIHGVADQQPLDTAQAAADLLLRASQGEATPTGAASPVYQSFEQHQLRLPVDAIKVRPTSRVGEMMEERQAAPRPLVRQMLSVTQQSATLSAQMDLVAKSSISREAEADGSAVAVTVAAEAEGPDELSLAYMDEQLSECVIPPEEAIYETVCLTSGGTGVRPQVDVYEMYWADLSRPVGNVVRWLLEFYQLLFNLCSLGRTSRELAQAEALACTKGKPVSRALWWMFGTCQVVGEQSLALFVPVLNLYVIAVGSVLLPLLVPDSYLIPVVVAIIGVGAALALAAGLFLLRRRFVPGGSLWPWFFFLVLIIGLAIAFKVWPCITPGNRLLWAAFVWWLVPLVAISYLMWAYQKSRPGAALFGLLLSAAVTAFYVRAIVSWHGDHAAMIQALLRTCEDTFILLRLSWAVILIAAFLTSVIGWFIPNTVPAGKQYERIRDRVRRATWTTNVTLVVPALVVFIVNITLWQVLISTFVPNERTVAASAAETPAKGLNVIKESPLWQKPYTARPPLFGSDASKPPPEPQPAWKAAWGLLRQSHSPSYVLIFSAFSLAALSLVWSIVPAVLGEIFGDRGSPGEKDARSKWLGGSLTAAFRAMRGSGEIVRFTVAFLMPLGLLISLVISQPAEQQRGLAKANEAVLYLGAALVIGIIVSRGPFRPLALGLRSGLDVALDVITWLRLHPKSSNPRARICARYVSLLRHIERWRDPVDGRGYDGVVILAHSQGTVITADLLRYLERKGIAPALPIYLFTMGCPLRQLYSLRFPHLYSWCRHYGDCWAGEEPSPATVRAKVWVNAYRSGDYVGRYLWHPDRGGDPWTTKEYPIPPATAESKREFCIGAGAHTHYWDETAPEIARELHRLVQVAAR